MDILLDGKEITMRNDLKVMVDVEDKTLCITITHEGVILDLCDSKSGEVIVTDAAMYAAIAGNM